MSWQSTLWAVQLKPERLNGVCDAAHVTLCLLANRADERGRGAFYSVKTMAAMRGLHDRTIRRHIAQLEAAGLITRGDQRYVQHIPEHVRPVVWNLCHRAIEEAAEDLPDPLTQMSPHEGREPVENPLGPPDTDVTPPLGPPDTTRRDPLTPGVTQEIINTSTKRLTYSGTEGDVEVVEISRPDRECIHGETALMFNDKRAQGRSRPRCPYCRQSGDVITLAPKEPAHV